MLDMPSNHSTNGTVADDGLLDAINLRLIAELQDDARLSLAELGRRVALSSPAVGERLRRLEDAGVIAGYRAVVDPRRLGFGFGVVIRIRPAGTKLALVARHPARHARGGGVPPRHRRRLLRRDRLRPRRGASRTRDRPVHAAWPDDDVDHAVLAGTAPSGRPAGPRGGDVKVSGSAVAGTSQVQWGEACRPPSWRPCVEARGPGSRAAPRCGSRVTAVGCGARRPAPAR